MTLAAKLQEANKEYQNNFLCKLMQITLDERLSKADVDAIMVVINSNPLSANHVPNNKLAMILRDEGFDISTSAIDRHRRGDCSCTRIKQGDK
jgi:hypothetical protein